VPKIARGVARDRERPRRSVPEVADNARIERILYICHSKEVGGAELYLEGLIGYATRPGTDGQPIRQVEVICRRDEQLDDWVGRLAAIGATVHRLDLKSPADYIGMFQAIRRADVVHLLVAYPAGKYQLAALLLAAAARRPLIATHQIAVDLRETELKMPRRTFWGAAFRLYGLSAKRNIASSRRGWEVLVHRYGFRERTTRLIYNGADVSLFKPLTGAARGEVRETIAAGVGAEHWPAGALLACTVARFTGQKGLPDLVDAAAEVVSACPRAVFVLIGDGELREELAKQVQTHELDRHFWFAGRRSLAEIASWMPGMDLFVLSSHDEGMPLALLEAMAAGCPAVATDVGGVGDVIADDSVGRLVPPRNVEALSHAIVDVFGDDDRRHAMSEAARVRVLSTFDVETCYGRTAALYDEVT
jgi:glycosyltransferase involved in cell wall biosynthesis